MEIQINDFGQTPIQLFTKPHVRRYRLSEIYDKYKPYIVFILQ